MSARFGSQQYVWPVFILSLLVGGCASVQSGSQPNASASHPSGANSTGRDSSESDTDAGESDPSSGNETTEVQAPQPAALERVTRGITGDGALIATIHTTEGAISCRLFPQKTPVTVANFIGLARGIHPWRDPTDGDIQTRTPFYDGLSFYRVIPDFIVQAGAPEGDPEQGPGYTLPDEFHPDLTHDRPGVLGMASQGPKTAGSQFYITLRPAPHLNAHHPIFGQCRDLDVVSRIATRPADANNRPEHPARIEYITFTRRKWAPEGEPTSDD